MPAARTICAAPQTRSNINIYFSSFIEFFLQMDRFQMRIRVTLANPGRRFKNLPMSECLFHRFYLFFGRRRSAPQFDFDNFVLLKAIHLKEKLNKGGKIDV